MDTAANLPASLRSYVCDFVARRRRVALFRAAGLAVAFALGWTLAWCLVDRLLQLPGPVRLALLTLNLAAVVALVFRPVADAFRRDVRWAEAAADIERRDASFAERLQTLTTQLLARPEVRGSPHMLDRLARDVDRDLAAVRRPPSSRGSPSRCRGWRGA